MQEKNNSRQSNFRIKYKKGHSYLFRYTRGHSHLARAMRKTPGLRKPVPMPPIKSGDSSTNKEEV